jgi:hypothetical protein
VSVEQGNGWIQTEVFEYTFETFLHFQRALPTTIYVVLDLGGAEHGGRRDDHARRACVVLIQGSHLNKPFMGVRVKDVDPILHCVDSGEIIGGISLFPPMSEMIPRAGRWPLSSDEGFLSVVISLRVEAGVDEG